MRILTKLTFKCSPSLIVFQIFDSSMAKFFNFTKAHSSMRNSNYNSAPCKSSRAQQTLEEWMECNIVHTTMALVDKYLNSKHNWKVFLLKEEGKTISTWIEKFLENWEIGWNMEHLSPTLMEKSRRFFQLNYSQFNNSFLHDFVVFLFRDKLNSAEAFFCSTTLLSISMVHRFHGFLLN